jgi:hypothetical protein
MEPVVIIEPSTQALSIQRPHPGSIAAVGPDAKAFFAAHGYSLARLARRNRVSPTMMVSLFNGRTVSARLVRNLRMLREKLEAAG